MREIVRWTQSQSLLRIVIARGIPADQVADVAQEVLLAVWRKCPLELCKEEPARRLYRWLAVVACRLAIRWKRVQSRHPKQALDNGHRELKDRREEETAILARREEECSLLRAWVKELREQEPDSYRLLAGHHFEGRSVGKLAEELGISPNAASHRLTRVRDRLRAWLLRHRDHAGESSAR